ncbi:hypothetical protein JAAARDRAFT_194704 [Jaapia argillacea MUCL 33604]|uniref:DUF5648 domain-containing protein n=1 Tax=Jaapia argillacea MUCL 33604 TaxID=933084 RepID=A0A067PSC5_9AGAM|nr:hypothetical protein JAAARDRAFT_194704 [Jaapia argillacea MUCL 33604]
MALQATGRWSWNTIKTRPLSGLYIPSFETKAKFITSHLFFVSMAAPKSAQSVPFYRAYSPAATDHFYTTNHAELQQSLTEGYSAEKPPCNVFATKHELTVPLYRLYTSSYTDHFYTTDANERDRAISQLGYTSEGIACYVYPRQECDTIPLYRTYSSSATDHFYTTSASERDRAVAELGYTNEGIAAYVLPYGIL